MQESEIVTQEQELTNNKFSITFGIRIERSFGLVDSVGSIIDLILYSGESSPFNKEFETVEPIKNGQFLVGEKMSLTINIDGIILTIITDDVGETTKKIKNTYAPFLVEKIIRKFNIKNINRIGMLYKYPKQDRAEDNVHLNSFIKNVTKQKISNADATEIKISKKINDTDGQTHREVDDYKNINFTYQKTSKGVFCLFDYQKYFIPSVEDIRETGIDIFIDESKNVLDTYFIELQ